MSISNSKSKFKSKIKIKFQYIQTILKYKPTLEKSSMKSKIEFKYDIRKQNVKYPSYLENIKLNLNKSTLPRKYPKSNQIYFTKNKFKYQSTRKKYSNYFTQSQSSNPILEKINQVQELIQVST